MKNKRIYTIAAVAALLGVAGCSDGEKPVKEVKSEALENWGKMPKEEKEEACSSYELLGKEAFAAIAASDEDISESDADIVVTMLEEECK